MYADYDAPLNEWGSPTEKYRELRNVLSDMVPESLSQYPLPPIPLPPPTAEYGEIKMTLYISLLSTLQYIPVSHIIYLAVYSRNVSCVYR